VKEAVAGVGQWQSNGFIFSLVIAGDTMRTLPVAIFSSVSYDSLNWGGLTAAPPSPRYALDAALATEQYRCRPTRATP